jgi:hypothetical protein
MFPYHSYTGASGVGSGSIGTGLTGYTMAREASYNMTAGRNLNGMINGGPVTQTQLTSMIQSQYPSGCVIPNGAGTTHTTTTTFPRGSR